MIPIPLADNGSADSDSESSDEGGSWARRRRSSGSSSSSDARSKPDERVKQKLSGTGVKEPSEFGVPTRHTTDKPVESLPSSSTDSTKDRLLRESEDSGTRRPSKSPEKDGNIIEKSSGESASSTNSLPTKTPDKSDEDAQDEDEILEVLGPLSGQLQS